MKYSALAALLTALALALVLGGWFVSGWEAVSGQSRSLRAAAEEEGGRRAALLATELESRLQTLTEAENARPFYEYQNLYHDPRGASEGQSVVPSPLAHGPPDTLVAAYFQLLPNGAVTLPTLNEEVPELTDRARAAEDLRTQASLIKVAPLLRAAAGVAATPERIDQRLAQVRPQVQKLAPSAYAQNIAPNRVYQSIQARVRTSPTPPVAAPPVEIRLAPFRWHRVHFNQVSRWVALRSVDTPDGSLTQGFFLSSEAVEAWLAQHSPAIAVHLLEDRRAPGGAFAPVALLEGSGVAVDGSGLLAVAVARTESLRRSFLQSFAVIAALALVCGALVVLLVARSERLARQRSSFAAAAAHELRTPLAGMSLYGDMLAHGLGDPERQRDYAAHIAQEAERLGRVVGNVLGFTQLEHRTLTLTPTVGDAAAVARGCVERMRVAFEQSGVKLAFEAPSVASAHFEADAVVRILHNLLDNAEKYTRGCADRAVLVSVRADGDAVVIEVADRGPGIPRSLRKRLFRPFARGGVGRDTTGLGLGLALARAQARAMGGELLVAERSGGGASFSLRLPQAIPDTSLTPRGGPDTLH